jgi:hypothetical protein
MKTRIAIIAACAGTLLCGGLLTLTATAGGQKAAKSGTQVQAGMRGNSTARLPNNRARPASRRAGDAHNGCLTPCPR